MTYRCAHCAKPLNEPVPVDTAYCSPGCRESAEDSEKDTKSPD